MYLQKVISKKTNFFVGLLKVNDEKWQDSDPNPDLDPLVRGMDPRIRIRIHTKMSWVRNTGKKASEVIVFFSDPRITDQQH
jgi:hypothetical protein